MTLKKTSKLAEITNTPRAKKIRMEDVEYAQVVEDDDILRLHLDVSSNSAEDSSSTSFEMFENLVLKVEDVFYK